MTPLYILLAVVFLGTGNCSSKNINFMGSFSSNSRLDVCEVYKVKSVRALFKGIVSKFHFHLNSSS